MGPGRGKYESRMAKSHGRKSRARIRAAAGAEVRVAARLESAGASPEEVQQLIALIRAGAVESAHAGLFEARLALVLLHGWGYQALAPPSTG